MSRFDDGLFFELDKETKEKLRTLAQKSERSMAAWVRYQIHKEFDRLEQAQKEIAAAG